MLSNTYTNKLSLSVAATAALFMAADRGNLLDQFSKLYVSIIHSDPKICYNRAQV